MNQNSVQKLCCTSCFLSFFSTVIIISLCWVHLPCFEFTLLIIKHHKICIGHLDGNCTKYILKIRKGEKNCKSKATVIKEMLFYLLKYSQLVSFHLNELTRRHLNFQGVVINTCLRMFMWKKRSGSLVHLHHVSHWSLKVCVGMFVGVGLHNHWSLKSVCVFVCVCVCVCVNNHQATGLIFTPKLQSVNTLKPYFIQYQILQNSCPISSSVI